MDITQPEFKYLTDYFLKLNFSVDAIYKKYKFITDNDFDANLLTNLKLDVGFYNVDDDSNSYIYYNCGLNRQKVIFSYIPTRNTFTYFEGHFYHALHNIFIESDELEFDEVSSLTTSSRLKLSTKCHVLVQWKIISQQLINIDIVLSESLYNAIYTYMYPMIMYRPLYFPIHSHPDYKHPLGFNF